MKKNKKEKIMLFCAGVLVVVFCSVIVRLGTMQIFAKSLHIKTGIVQTILGDNEELMAYDRSEEGKAARADFTDVSENASIKSDKIDWKEKYPFPEGERNSSDKTSPSTKSSIGNRIFSTVRDKIKTAEQKAENWTGKYLWHYMDVVQWADAYKGNIVRWNIRAWGEYNGVVELTDGHLTVFKQKKDVTAKAENVAAFADACQEQGIPLVMVLVPSKIAPSDVDVSGKLDFSNQNADDFVRLLREYGVDCMDIRDNIIQDGLDHHDLFYRTDHHWKVSTARWATEKIFSHLNEFYGYHADPSLLEPDRYDEVLYPASFLGSRGKKMTLARTTPDDFSLYYPKFTTSFTISIPSLHLEKQGDFSIMYQMEAMDFSNGLYKSNPYSALGYGDQDFIDIHNHLKTDGKHFLLIHDSFGDAVTPFLALGMEHLQTIDLRHFTGSLQTFVQKERPDAVIILYFVQELGGNGNETKHEELFDFR